jgi:cytochrome c556
MKKIKYVVAAVLLCTLASGTGLAHPPNISEEMNAYIKRDGLMHLIRAQRLILHSMLVSQTEVDQAEFVRAVKALEALFGMIPSTFKENLMVYDSLAKPEIWRNWDDFVSKAEGMRNKAAEIAALAESQGANAALDMVRQLDCGDCHNIYRR